MSLSLFATMVQFYTFKFDMSTGTVMTTLFITKHQSNNMTIVLVQYFYEPKNRCMDGGK